MRAYVTIVETRVRTIEINEKCIGSETDAIELVDHFYQCGTIKLAEECIRIEDTTIGIETPEALVHMGILQIT